MNNEKRLDKSKFLTFIFSLVPGAGHMYLGYLKTGIIIMATFILLSYIVGLTGISLFSIFLPVIWAYSFFDTFQLYNGEKSHDDYIIDRFLNKINVKYIGYALIFVGVISVSKQVLYPMFYNLLQSLGFTDIYMLERYIQTIVVAVIFIFGGFKLINYNKTLDEVVKDISDSNNEDDFYEN